MQDIRKPYTRSRSSNDLQSRVEQFEAARYKNKDDEYEENSSVEIPVKRVRRDIRDMDMYPRQKVESSPRRFQDEDINDDNENFPSTPSKGFRGRRKFSLGWIFFIIGLIFLVLSVVLYTYVFNSATINITPKWKDVNDFNRTFVFVREGINKEGIPFIATTTSFSKSKALTFSETRKIETKASGNITVYNNFDSTPLKLIKNTRFQSTSGKIYRINKSIEVPGKKGDTPGSVEVTIYADDVGKEYNSQATEFTIPGFKGMPEEKGFYAKSVGPLKGGASGNTSLVSLPDLNAAKDSLMIALDKEIKNEAAKLKQDNYIALSGTLEIIYSDNEQEVLSGATEIYKITGVGYTLLAKESELAKSIGKTTVDYANEPVRLDTTEPLKVTRREQDHILGAETLSLLVEGSPRIIWINDKKSIQDMLKNKKTSEFKTLMKNVGSLESAELNLSPVWMSSFPNTNTKIFINEILPKR